MRPPLPASGLRLFGAVSLISSLLALALLLLLVFLWFWSEEPFVPLAEPALLENFFGCDAVQPMIDQAFEPVSRRRATLMPMRSENIQRMQRRLRIPRVQLVGSKVYITCPEEGDACMTHQARTLALLTRLTKLPDADFLYDDSENSCHHTLLTTRSRGQRGASVGSVPVIATETEDGCDQLLAPPRALGALQDNGRFLGRASSRPWTSRRNVALFRGTATGGEALDAFGRPASARARAVAFSLRHPNLLDARFAGRHSLGSIDRSAALRLNWTDENAYMTWDDALQYRAQLVLDGNTLPDRLAFVLASMTAVLKQQSRRREAFHRMMRPYEHYIPIAADLSDLEAQLRWALSNASRLHRIATNGAALALHLLSRRAQLCHWVGLLRRLAEYTALPVELDPKARLRSPRAHVLHESVVQSNPLRPQLTHVRTGPMELFGVIRRLHLTPCTTLSSAHLCIDL